MTAVTGDIIRALPHRYPFLMVDRVVEVVPGKRAVAEKLVTADGHFCHGTPGGTSPEMLIIEAMAQVGALTVAAMPGGEDDGTQTGGIRGYLAGLNDVQFHMRPKAGDRVVMTLDFVASIGTLARFRGEARISGALAIEAGLTFTAERVII